MIYFLASLVVFAVLLISLWRGTPAFDRNEVYREMINKDLREVYPTQFQHDLERLDQLRAKSAAAASSLSSRHDVDGGCTIVHVSDSKCYVRLPDGSLLTAVLLESQL